MQRLETHTLRLRAFFTQAALLVGFVLLVVAVVEDPLAVAFAGQNVGGDAVDEFVLDGFHGDFAVNIVKIL